MTTKQLDTTELLKAFYRYCPDKQAWQYLDHEYGWVMVSSKEDAIHDATATVMVFAYAQLEYLQSLEDKVPVYVPPPALVELPTPPPPPPLRKTNDFSLANGEAWVIIAFVVGMIVSGIISQISGACI